MSKAALSLIQTGLRDAGYPLGAIDGVFGGKSQAAMSAFQLAGYRAASGQITPSTKGMILQGSAKYQVTEICLHCSATRPDWMGNHTLAEKVAEIGRWHRDRGWRAIGYHWIIDRDGKSLAGRAETEIGAGVEGHNRGVIHICLLGGHGSSESDRFATNFSASQDVTVRGLIQGISMRTQIRRISGHNEFAAKACPGFNVPKWLQEAA